MFDSGLSYHYVLGITTKSILCNDRHTSDVQSTSTHSTTELLEKHTRVTTHVSRRITDTQVAPNDHSISEALSRLAQHSTAQHSTAQHSTAQHSTAQHSTVQYSTVQYSTVQWMVLM